MKECFKTEIKTLLNMKSISIGLLLLLIIPSYIIYSNYKDAQSQMNYIQIIYDDIQINISEGNEVNTNNIDDDIFMIYKTYEPHMAVNNSFIVLIGTGIIIFPIIFSLYIGNEYSRSRIIKTKTVHYSLIQVFVSKIIVMFLILLLFETIYTALNIYLIKLYWNKYLAEFFMDYMHVNVITMSNFIIIALTTFIILFYTMICFTISLLFKRSIAGIITTIIINFVVLPNKFSFHNMFFDLINKTFFISEASPYMFTLRITEVLPVHIELMILITFFIMLLGVILFAGLRQKNS